MCLPKVQPSAPAASTVPSLQSASALLLGGAGQRGILGRTALQAPKVAPVISATVKKASQLLTGQTSSTQAEQASASDTPGLNPNILAGGEG